MNRFDKMSTRALIKLWIELENQRHRAWFYGLNPSGGHYTREQRDFAIEKAGSIGVRAASRLLQLPRRTIQRWLKAAGISVQRCPDWVFEWADWRRKRNEKWERIASYKK